MRYAAIVFLAAWMITSAAVAQQVSATNTSDSWARPATAASAITYRDQPISAARPSSSLFIFRQHHGNRPADQPPPSAMDKASVMGAKRPWQNGRPPVDCAMTPHAAACQH